MLKQIVLLMILVIFRQAVDQTKDIFSYPFLMIQVTRFKCGGVCLGFRLCHKLADGTSYFHFINSWAEMTRGVPISIPPFFDRTTVDVGVPSSPTFPHIEYDPPPPMNSPAQNLGTISTAILKLSPDQINTLKLKLKKDHGSTINYSRFEILAAHIWRCVCKARGLFHDQASKLYVPVNGRTKLKPPIPSGYVGNVVFITTPVASSGDILSESLSDTVERIHTELKQNVRSRY
ncbi:Hydroxycinnamoyl-CoA shikimate/quinate hydroxycinnamoyl transferase [Melia azedarach]|uniref:Hydroxycinnamoyl-CoA shikimate/quinate hydroxycinnamoyl transferase n=1 Tax=Melia azedarach TaxID=155640 RepID=A0ACC1XDU1_MELAZ|nr:Hydroxycinnamoyl-CoA shikimate/quinate hydroxycinnamoyl transferase [Melia azedarach]